MSWGLEAYAALAGGIAFLVNNPVQCSSTMILQAALILVVGGGVAVIAMRAAASERMRRSLEPIDLGTEPGLAAALRRAARTVGVQRLVTPYWAPENGPRLAALGYFRPSLVVARSVARRLDADELEAALAHELLHMIRRDALRVDAARLLVGLVVLSLGFALLLFATFFAGAFGMDRWVAVCAVALGLAASHLSGCAVARRMERWAEFACDRAAAAGGGGPLAAAAALVKVAQLEKRGAGLSLAVAAPLFSAETFEMRIRRLTGAAEARRSAVACLSTAATAMLVGAVFAVFLLLQPIDLRRAADFGCSACGLVADKADYWSGV